MDGHDVLTLCRQVSTRYAIALQGNALLVGVGGSGKQSLAKLAAFMAGCEVFEITLTRGYDETMFREDLKQLYTLLGADNKKVKQTANCCVHPQSPQCGAAGWCTPCMRTACNGCQLGVLLELHRCSNGY